MKAFACLTALCLVAHVATASAIEQDSAPSKMHVTPEANVEGSKPRRCWRARNIGIAETSKDYYASCQQRGSEEIPAESNRSGVDSSAAGAVIVTKTGSNAALDEGSAPNGHRPQ